MNYPGGKAKTFQHIINHIPPHNTYIEPFLGLGSVMKAKMRAKTEYGVDLDNRALKLSGLSQLGIQLLNDDGISFLEKYPFQGQEVVYCDPPYLPCTRKQKRVYKYDLNEKDHIRFLNVVIKLKTRIIISGYDNNLYQEYLQGWNKYHYSAKAHDGSREECIWYNFHKPKKLHDYRYLGTNFRERQTIRRRLDRMKNRIEEMTAQERSFLLNWLQVRENSNAD